MVDGYHWYSKVFVEFCAERAVWVLWSRFEFWYVDSVSDGSAVATAMDGERGSGEWHLGSAGAAASLNAVLPVSLRSELARRERFRYRH